MSLEATEVRVQGFGHLYRAPVGTDFPASISEAVDFADWIDLGYADPDGVTFEFGRSVNRIMGWQSFDPLRIVVTEVPKKVSAKLLQWNRHTVSTALGGGEFDEPSPGEYTYEPPDESEVDEFALIIEGVDGDVNYRFCYRRAFNEDPVSFSFVRNNPTMLPVGMSILAAADGAKPYIIQTDDPSFDEDAGDGGS